MSPIYICAPISEVLSDTYLFPAMQILLVFFALFCLLISIKQSGNFAQVTRGESSMGLFYSFYAVVSGLAVAICFQVEIAKDYRVIWSITDAILIAYVCIFNPWFRNKLLGWAAYLKQIETR